MGSSSSHISRGHGDKALNSRGVLYGARSLTSNRMLPHCDFEGLPTLALKRWRTSSPPPRAHVRHHTERFQCSALSAVGCVMQRPSRRKPKSGKKIGNSFFGHFLLEKMFGTNFWNNFSKKKFSRYRLARRTLHTQPAVLKALHWNLLSVVPHARGVVENLFSTASGPVSTVLRSRSGAAFCCWLGTWFHTALLCCNGPCPHDPRDVA